MGKQSWGILGAFSIGMVRNPSQDRTKNLLTCILTTQYKASRILRDKKETYPLIFSAQRSCASAAAVSKSKPPRYNCLPVSLTQMCDSHRLVRLCKVTPLKVELDLPRLNGEAGLVLFFIAASFCLEGGLGGWVCAVVVVIPVVTAVAPIPTPVTASEPVCSTWVIALGARLDSNLVAGKDGTAPAAACGVGGSCGAFAAPGPWSFVSTRTARPTNPTRPIKSSSAAVSVLCDPSSAAAAALLACDSRIDMAFAVAAVHRVAAASGGAFCSKADPGNWSP